jgi:hypothetical protein
VRRDSSLIQQLQLSVALLANLPSRVKQGRRVRVADRYDAFICYPAKKGVYDTFHHVLKEFFLRHEIYAYSATKPPSGCIWEDEIFKTIRRSNSSILLLSPPFFRSRFIQDKELPLLIEAAELKQNKKPLYPILVENCTKSQLAPLQKFQFCNRTPLLELLDDPPAFFGELGTIANEIASNKS